MKKLLALVLALIMVLAVAVPTAFANPGEYAGKTVILHSNDVHGQLSYYQYIAGLKKYYQEEGAQVILVDAGDFSQGTAYVSDTKGADAVTMLNAAGYDIVTLGNHEFDYGYAQLQQNMASFTGTVLCADVFDANGDTIFDANKIITTGGVKIGFFGLETPEAQTKANPALIQGLTFKAGNDLYACAQDQVTALEDAGADVIICLSHLGVDGESAPNRSVDLYANTTGIDMIIDAHSHTVMTATNLQPIQSTGSPSTGVLSSNIGVIVIDNNSKSIVDNTLIAVDDNTPVDTAVKTAADAIINRVDEEYGQVFATSLVTLNGAKAPNGNRDSETNNGDLITDAMIWALTEKQPGSITGVDASNVVAVMNGGGIRAAINAGDVRKIDVKTVLPFSNTLAIVYVTGNELLEALEASTYCSPTAVGGFPQTAGMKWGLCTYQTYDQGDLYPGSTYYEPNSINRVAIYSVNGKAFDPKATYAVISNNFCASGGDTYYAFASASSSYDTGLLLEEVVMDYITEKLGGVIGMQYAAPQNRMIVLDTWNDFGSSSTTTAATTGTTAGVAVVSAKTADAGIVVYVGMAVLSITGSAAVIGRRKEF